jgi:6-phosphogluconolactonase (cycloisomerase 2 family)
MSACGGSRVPTVIRRATILLSLAAVVLALPGAAGARSASLYSTRGTLPGSVYQFAVASNGDVTPRSPEYVSTVGNFAHGIVITPEGGHVYATATASTSLSQFGVSTSGLLSALTPPSIPAAKESYPLAISPDGGSLYTAHGSVAVEQFTVGADGRLAAKSPPTVPSGGSNDIVLSPDGRFLYVSNFGGTGHINQYEVQAGGTLKPLSPPSVSSDPYPVGMAVSPDGRHLYAGTESAFGIDQFNIGPSGGLTPMTPPRLATPPETLAEHLAVSPDGGNLYASNFSPGGGIIQLAIGPDGALSHLSPSAILPGAKVQAVEVSPDGRSLYAGFYSGEKLERFSIGAGGALSPTSNVIEGIGVPNDLAVSPDQGPIAALAVTPAPAGLAGSSQIAGREGPNRSPFNGRWGKKRLKPGTYRLSLMPASEGGRGAAVQLSFRILRAGRARR